MLEQEQTADSGSPQSSIVQGSASILVPVLDAVLRHGLH